MIDLSELSNIQPLLCNSGYLHTSNHHLVQTWGRLAGWCLMSLVSTDMATSEINKSGA